MLQCSKRKTNPTQNKIDLQHCLSMSQGMFFRQAIISLFEYSTFLVPYFLSIQKSNAV